MAAIDYLKSALGIFDNTKELLRQKAEAARIAAQQKAAQMKQAAQQTVQQVQQKVTQSAPARAVQSYAAAPSNTLGNKMTTFFASAAKPVLNAAGNFGHFSWDAIFNQPGRNRQMQADTEKAITASNRALQAAKAAREAGRPDLAASYTRSMIPQLQAQSDKFSQAAAEAEAKKKVLIGAGTRTALYTAAAANLPATAAAGVINAGLGAAFNGKTSAEDLGTNFGEGMKYGGMPNPVIKGGLAVKALGGGLVNLAEDALYAKTVENRNLTPREIAFSLALPAAFETGGHLLSAIKGKPSEIIATTSPEGFMYNKAGQIFDPVTGRFAKTTEEIRLAAKNAKDFIAAGGKPVKVGAKLVEITPNKWVSEQDLVNYASDIPKNDLTVEPTLPKPAAGPKPADQVITEASGNKKMGEFFGAKPAEPTITAPEAPVAGPKPKTAEEIINQVQTKPPENIPEPPKTDLTPAQPDLATPAVTPQTTNLEAVKPTDTSLPTSISRKQVPASPLNVERLDLNAEQKGRVSADQIKELRDVLGDKEIVNIARSAGIDTKTNTIDQTAEKIAGQLNVRRQVVELEAQRTKLLAEGAPQADLEAITRQIAETSRISREQGTDIARQLSARRIIANEINTPMQRVFQLMDKAGVNPDVYAKDAANIDFSNGQNVIDFYRKYVPAEAGNWLDLVRYNSMLSSPNTHINNFFSNLQGSLVVAPIEKEITAGVDAIKSALFGTRREYASGEGLAYAKGYLQSLATAKKKFTDVMTNKSLSGNLDYREIPLTASGDKLRHTEDVLRFPMKLLEASDQFFTTLTKGGVDASLARREAAGIKVNNPELVAEAEAAKRLFRSKLGDNNGSTMLNAIDIVANTVQKLKGSKNPVVANIAKFSLPFIQTPTNILKQGMEYSPAGILTIAGSRTKTEQIAKAVMGTAIATGVATLVSNDRITWAEPTSEKQRDAFRAAGMQPYAVKVGDKWVSYSKLHPAIAFNLALVAAVKHGQDNKDLDETQGETILKAASKWLQFFADQSYVKSIGDLVSNVKGDIEAPARTIGNYAQQLVPYRALMGWVARIVDPYQRKVDPSGGILEKQLDQLKTQIPLLSMTVPAREDQYGQPIANQNRWWNAFAPNKVTTEQPTAKQDYLNIIDQAKMDKENRQMKEKLQREIDQPTTVPKAGASESPLVPGTGKQTTGTESTTTSVVRELTKQEKTRVKMLLDYGKDVPEDQLVSYYLADIKGTPSDTGYKQTIRQKSILDKYTKIEDDENLSNAQKDVIKNAIVKESGFSGEQVAYWQDAKLAPDLKYQKAKEDAATFDHKQLVEYLVKGRATVLGEQFANTSLIDKFYEDKMLTKDEAKWLKALKYDDKTDTFKLDRDYKGAGSGTGTSNKKTMDAFFKAAKTMPKLGSYKYTPSKVDWGNVPKSTVSPEDAKIDVNVKPYQRSDKMTNFFKPKATKLSSGEAQAVVTSLKGGGSKDQRLQLRYAGRPR